MDLELLRQEIETTDMEIMDLISRRTDLAEQIGRNKMENGLPIRDISVEKKVVKRYTDASEGTGISKYTLEKIAKALIQEAVDREAKVTCPKGKTLEISIIGGAGKMGKWMGDMFAADGHKIKIIDPSSNNGLTIVDSKNSDIVIVSVPIGTTEAVLRQLDEVCGADALIFDLTSLKTPISFTLRKMAQERKVCSVHPMFGPSANSMYARNLIICDCGCKKAVEETSRLFDNKGGNIRVMDLDKHDEYMSYVLGLSHAVNIAFFTVLQRSGLTFEDLSSVASTTFNKNLETNESVALEDPELYYEIQHTNAYRDVMWDKFSKAVTDIRRASRDENDEEFVKLMRAGKEYFSH